MTAPRFLQIHTLHSYTAALLNRDDSGLAKRLPYGDTLRTRISSHASSAIGGWRIRIPIPCMRSTEQISPIDRAN